MSRPSQLTSSLGSLGSLAPMKTNYKVHTALFPEGSQRETSPHDVLQKYFSPGSKPLRSLRGGKRTEKICINCELQKYLKPEVKVDACNTRLKQEDPKVQTQPGQLNNTWLEKSKGETVRPRGSATERVSTQSLLSRSSSRPPHKCTQQRMEAVISDVCHLKYASQEKGLNCPH